MMSMVIEDVIQVEFTDVLIVNYDGMCKPAYLLTDPGYSSRQAMVEAFNLEIDKTTSHEAATLLVT